jgi:hypothetical protein
MPHLLLQPIYTLKSHRISDTASTAEIDVPGPRQGTDHPPGNQGHPPITQRAPTGQSRAPTGQSRAPTRGAPTEDRIA